MANKLIAILILLLTGGLISALEIEDINGTWVDNEMALNNNSLPEWRYSWGMGRTIPNSSVDFDLEKKQIRLSGMGLYIIEKVFKEDEDLMRLELFSIEDKDFSNPLHMEIRFIDSLRAYIICYPQEGWWSKPLSSGEKWIWYRLSGPAEN
jgi:hypothetical protein